MMLRTNKYIKKLLEGSKSNHSFSYNSDEGLTLSQIEWRMENMNGTIGIVGSEGILFTKYSFLILLRKSDGDYVLLAPSSKKDKGTPCYLYDIIDIKEFINRYPIQPLFLDWDKEDREELYFQLEEVKDRVTRGFIETELNKETRILELI